MFLFFNILSNLLRRYEQAFLEEQDGKSDLKYHPHISGQLNFFLPEIRIVILSRKRQFCPA